MWAQISVAHVHEGNNLRGIHLQDGTLNSSSRLKWLHKCETTTIFGVLYNILIVQQIAQLFQVQNIQKVGRIKYAKKQKKCTLSEFFLNMQKLLCKNANLQGVKFKLYKVLDYANCSFPPGWYIAFHMPKMRISHRPVEMFFITTFNECILI